jgi:hypothetical protein
MNCIDLNCTTRAVRPRFDPPSFSLGEANWLRKENGRPDLLFDIVFGGSAWADVPAGIRNIPVTHRFPRRGPSIQLGEI